MSNDQNDNMEKNQEQSSTNIEKQTQIPEGNQEMGFQQIRCKEEITRDSNYKTCEKSNWYNPNGGISGLCGFLTSPELKKLSGHWTPFLALGLTLMILGFMAI
ncbi:MAG: hypothetical protein IKW74_01355, partial [Thermoguttaceae bacterium]|nr:hypothetical protein [Thermoguttaceae bacterium]